MKSTQTGPTVILYAKFIFSGVLVICGVRKETLRIGLGARGPNSTIFAASGDAQSEVSNLLLGTGPAGTIPRLTGNWAVSKAEAFCEYKP